MHFYRKDDNCNTTWFFTCLNITFLKTILQNSDILPAFLYIMYKYTKSNRIQTFTIKSCVYMQK